MLAHVMSLQWCDRRSDHRGIHKEDPPADQTGERSRHLRLAWRHQMMTGDLDLQSKPRSRGSTLVPQVAIGVLFAACRGDLFTPTCGD